MVNKDFSFIELVPDLSPLLLVDVGAAPLPKPPMYQNLVDKNKAAVIGFEPNEKACAAFNAAAKPPSRCYPAFVGRGGPATFHETKFGFTSSLYRPDAAVISRFTNLPGFIDVIATHAVETRRLDDMVTDAAVDFMKIDVQGAELDVLCGAERLLPTMLAVETEVEFVPLYEGQPLFADIDAHMRKAGFQLHALLNQHRMFYTPVADPEQPLNGLNQFVAADAVYMRNLGGLKRLPREQVLKLLTILHDFYGSFDLCIHILAEMRGRGMAVPHEAYVKRLGMG